MKIKNYLLIGYAGWDNDGDDNIKKRIAISDFFTEEDIIEMAHNKFQKKHRVTSFRLEELPVGGNKMKDTILQILGQFYENKYNTEEYDYETVDEYYTFLGHELGLTEELQNVGITSTSELQEKMLNRDYKI